jgi:2-oxoglutarate dehydrogenase E2 component (dihydrolipoamide succinyltransferase)
MGFIEVRIPAMGEGIIEATIIRWLVHEGDTITFDTPLVEIATDKVDSEIPAPQAGTLKKILRREGDVPRVGETIALILPDGVSEPLNSEQFGPSPEQDKPAAPQQPIHFTPGEKFIEQEIPAAESQSPAYLSPFIRKAAKEMGIGIEELAAVRGTALGSRISKKDFYRYLELKMKGMSKSPAEEDSFPGKKEQVSAPPIQMATFQGPHELVKMDRMRKLIADHMLRSKQTAPHVTSFYEADLSSLVQWRNSIKDEFHHKYKEKLTFTPLFVEAVAKALKDFPRINSSLEGENILIKKEINIGIATALPDGNLIVPVVKQADQLNLEGLASRVNDLSARAREGALLPSEITGGTFTITNLGMFRSLSGTPVINQPESAILAVGAILRKPAVVMGPFGESIGIRDICVLSLSYDHRIIDGALGGQFLRQVAEYLEKADLNRIVQ